MATARLWDVAISPADRRAADRRQLRGRGGLQPGRQDPGHRSAWHGTARLWDVATHQQIGAPLTADEVANAVAFSPDGKTLATASSDGTLRLWDVATQPADRCAADRPTTTTIRS